MTIGDLVGQRSLLAEGPPSLTWASGLRAAALAVAGTGLLAGLRLAAVGLLAPAPLTDWSSPGLRKAPLVPAAVAIAGAVLVWIGPGTLNRLVAEDGPVEWASAVLCFAAAGMACLAGLRFRSRPGRRLAATWCVVLGGCCLLIGLEEVSFFQRQLNLTTPAALAGNEQQELNLHNVATDGAENAYYAGAFALCVALPAVAGDRRLPHRLRSLQPALPGLAVLRSSVLAGAVVYEMWDAVPVQMTFWGSFAALGITMGRSPTGGKQRWLALVVAVVAAGMLAGGSRMVRSWDDTEVRELIIPFGLAVYGRQLLDRARFPC
ncbi:MAG: hypothetical protein OEW29_00095 [Acidimicrobiia bacterium]|nr:hypothetical protein [Acidimicrobiia bacterium]